MNEEREALESQPNDLLGVDDEKILANKILKLVDAAIDVIEATLTESKEIKDAAIRAINEDGITYETFKTDYIQKIEDILGTVEERIGVVVDRTRREEEEK